MIVKNVSFLAKKRYCEICRPSWLSILYKVQDREELSTTERKNYEQLVREILNVVNNKAELISGLTRNNRKNARYAYGDCIYIIKCDRGIGTIVTVQREL